MKDALLEIFRQMPRRLLATGLLLLVTLGFWIAVDGYQRPKIAAAQQRWSELRSQVAVAGRNDVSALYRQGNVDLETLKSRIPPKRQFPRLLGEMLEQASSNGITTGPITYKPHDLKDDKLLMYELTMGVSGGYAALKSYLADLQRNRELVVIEDVTFTNSDLFEENVTMDLKLRIYLREDT